MTQIMFDWQNVGRQKIKIDATDKRYVQLNAVNTNHMVTILNATTKRCNNIANVNN